jgi:hypothetical protein
MKLGVHIVLLAVAASAAILVWTRDRNPAVSMGDITVWNVRAADVERVAFEGKGKKLTLDARKDSLGRFFVGTAETTAAPDGLDSPAQTKNATFVSVGPATQVVESLAPLKAVRDIGKIGDDRSVEFGLKEPEGSLVVVIGGTERKLELGSPTPGGGSRYVRDATSHAVYALKTDVVRDLEAGESALGERELHAFKDPDIRSARLIAANGKKREVVRTGPDSKRIWADPATPDTADETVGNWIAMLDRLRPTDWLASSPPRAGIAPVVRVEYQVKGTEGAFVEIAKVTGNGPKPEFLVRTERTRLWAKTFGPVGEQIEQDLGTVLR